MIKTIMNVCVKFANDKDSNRANVELLVPKMAINSEIGCTKATRLQLLADRAQFALTREHFELIANERGEKINLYSKDPIILKCEVEPYEKSFENGYLMHYFKIKFSESITRCVKFAPHQEKNMKFIKFPFEFNKVQEIDEEAIAMLDIPDNVQKTEGKKENK